MFVLDLARLRRSGPLDLSGEIPLDDPVWETLPAPRAPVGVALRAQWTPTGQILVQGRFDGGLEGGCRRCLEPVPIPLRHEVVLVWEGEDALGDAGDDPGSDGGDEIRRLEPGAGTLELDGALREELILLVPRWVVCRDNCAGLCPHCGINRNEETCTCSQEGSDPRWDALRGLTFDQGK
jgi:uncharacterized protein